MSFLSDIYFVLQMCYIISTELFYYLIYNNYTIFIDNLSKKLANINILYVKLFQAFALNNNLIDDITNNQLLKFTNEAPWNYSDIEFFDLIDICSKYDIILPKGFESPINSGMISLVFKGIRSIDNQEIIIKMKRKNIEQKLNEAIKKIRFCLYILSYIPFIKNYNLDNFINTNINTIREQINFKNEVNNMIQIKNNCKNLNYVVIPKVYEEVTSEFPNIILMEYINGKTIIELDKKDYKTFAKQIIKFGIVTSFLHGITHGDLHSGNILFIKDDNDINNSYKIGILDFGIVYNINEKYRLTLLEIITELFTTSAETLSEKFINCGIIEPIGILQKLPIKHYNNLLKITTDIFKEVIQNSKKANQIQLYNFLIKFTEYIHINKLSNLELKLGEDFVKTQLVIGMAHGVTLTLCDDDFISLADNVINELFHTDLFLVSNI